MKNQTIQEKTSFPQMEENIQKFWEENKIFEKSITKENPNGDFVFYDGPPFATGLPHYGHIVASTQKDVIPRYKTMKGYRVERKWGWDCHGLPVENLIEKDLGLKTKEDIEKMGIDKFNEACSASVMRYADEWKKFIPRMGRWVDMDNDYKTMDVNYMESIWWVFKKLYDKDLIYEGYKSMHLCPRCETTLSNFEVTQGYKDIKDLSVTAKFKIKNETNLYALAWTTTPWTLPGNVALAVGENIDYVKVEMTNKELGTEEIFILAKELVEKVFKDKEYDIIEELKGRDLIGLEYEPLFNYFYNKKTEHKENGWKIYADDFVTTNDGVGIVHIAPAFGDDDMKLAQKYSLPFVQHVKMNGHFIDAVIDFKGMEVKPKENHSATDIEIIKWLAHNGKLFHKEKYEHSYPHCWRCDTPLLNYATSSWFVKVEELKEKMLKNNAQINWMPEHIKDGRFGKWLENARDWAISRSRFWGTPLPVWRCKNEKCNQIKVVGSIDELKKNSEKEVTKIIFVRHGESQNNVLNIRSNELDKFPLTQKGKEQIEQLSKMITDKIDVIISSPVLRAKESAEILKKKLNIKTEIEIDSLITEFNHGEWNGATKEELNSNGDYKNYKTLQGEEKFNFKFGLNGESRSDVINRVLKFIKKITVNHSGKTILITSHFGINFAINKVIKNFSVEQYLEDEKKHTDHKLELFYVDINGHAIDLHKQHVDKIKIKCEKCNGEMRRIPEVLDCWFESGSMPYAQKHYMGESLSDFDPEIGKNFPAEFISEGVDQTRGWFYTLTVLATALFDKPAFKNVIVNGIVLAEDGQKMAKRLKNYPDPNDLINKYGADAMRFYLMSSPVVKAGDLSFSEKGVNEIFQKVIMLLWNVYGFYETYQDQLQPVEAQNLVPTNLLDEWILAKLDLLINEMTENLDNYDLQKASRPILEFINELSTWYLRRSRDRFKFGDENDKQSALQTMNYTLLTLSKLMAPFTPFIAESLYQKVKSKKDGASVHLKNWPVAKPHFKNVGESTGLSNAISKGTINFVEKSITDMDLARKIVEAGLFERSKNQIKIRQVLNSFSTTAIKESELSDELISIIKDELNIKELKFGEDKLDITLTPELIQEGYSREIIRTINLLRKDAGLSINDQTKIFYENNNELKKVFEIFGDEIVRDTLSTSHSILLMDEIKIKKEIKIGEKNVFVGLQ